MLLLPGPTDIPDESYRSMTRRLINHRSKEFRDFHEGLLKKVREVLGTRSDVFVLTCSGTGGVEAAVANVIDRDDRVLVFRNGQFAERVGIAAEYYSDNVIYRDMPWGTAPTSSFVKEALDEVGDVDVAVLVHNETSTGALTTELGRIARVCKESGAFLILDAITSIGGVDFRFDNLDVSVVVTATQKCLAGPPGLSVIGVKDYVWEKILRKKKRPYYFDLITHRDFMTKLETPFTPAIPLFYSLDASLSQVLNLGIDRWVDRHRKGANAFYESVYRMGLEVLPPPEFRSPTLIAVKMPDGIVDHDVADYMAKKFDVHVGVGVSRTKGKLIRIGNMGLVTPDRVREAIIALSESLRHLGYNSPRFDVDELTGRNFK
ncbi:MAG: alanine--glyoxylate aminotransferase family protein [Aigarchaeota archaeon]|nr:alanine--glyoxylate aminotransferase family protein [Aigarchaeota archaeon]MDW8092325.1 alanine--glyoxylate aminotransferase family protein [Nitrososphaerota archaeon]